MFESSIIEISRTAIKNNLSFLKKHLNNVEISSVIKGNAYGHGIEQIVEIAEDSGIKHFSVFNVAEAKRVFDKAKNSPIIMIMGYVDGKELRWAIKNNIEFFVFDITRLETAIKYAKVLKKKAKIHIEIETGLNRTGLNKKELKEVINIIKENSENLEISGLCTHYAGAESIGSYYRIKKQIRNFNATKKLINSQGIFPKKYHSSCSAAAMTYPEARMDLVRIGMMQYGSWPSFEVYIHYLNTIKKNKKREEFDAEINNPLKRALSWKSRIMSIKKIKKGEFIGYGNSFLAQEDMFIATIPVGYSDGYSRSLSNQGRMIINGIRVAVVGMVNMNMTMVDVTNIANVNKGDEVILIGKHGDIEINVASFSEISEQLNYDILTSLPESIPRKIVN